VTPPKTETRYELPRQGTDMDHTKPYAYASSDQGSDGSYPSHDGFGDESKP
jgi:hypothetical protein